MTIAGANTQTFLFREKMKSIFADGRVTAIIVLLPPACLLFTLFVILPLSVSGYYAFFNWNGYGTPTNFVGVQNFSRMFGHSVFHQSVFNTLKIAVVSIAIQLPLALFLALLVYRKTPENTMFRLIFFVPYILAEIAAGLIWSFIFDGNYGAVADITRWLGVAPYFILSDREWAFTSILVVIVWKYFGFHMMIYIAALQGVPNDLIEAASIEGAKRYQIMRQVQIPLIKPAIIVSVFFSVIGALQIFDLVIPLTNGGPSNSTHTIVTYLYTFGLTRLNIGYGASVGLVLFVTAVLLAVFYQRLFMRNAA